MTTAPASGRRCVIYTRVSTRGQLEGSGPETQEELCRKAAAERGYDVLRVALDAHTGTEIERPAISELLAEAQAGAFDILLADVVDRFGRGGAAVAILGTLFENAGVRIDFASQKFEEGPQGDLLREVLASFAGFERAMFLRRSRLGRVKRVERGARLPGRKAPYGYRYTDDRRGLVVEAGEAVGVRRIFRESAEGRHTRAIARGLEADGIPGPTGGAWHHYIVGYLVKNPLYQGDDLGLRSEYVRSGWRKHQVAKHPSEWAKVGDAPPIVDRDTWAAAQPRAKGRPVLLRPEESTLQGRVECAHCGSTMMLTTYRGTGKRAYRCVKPQGQCAPGHSILTERCDAAAWEKVRQVVAAPEVIRRALELRRAQDPLRAVRQALRDRQAEVAKKRANLLEALSDADVRQAVLSELERLAALGRELDAEAQRLADTDALQAGIDARLGELMRWCAEAANRVDEWPVLERPLLYEALGLRLVVARAEPRIEPVVDLTPVMRGIRMAHSSRLI